MSNKIKEVININEILEFIHRRFPADCNWLSGNCYYFSYILSSRFPDGKIYYDVINGHFVFYHSGIFYDWTGIVKLKDNFIEWDKFDEYDSLQKQRIIRDCIM